MSGKNKCKLLKEIRRQIAAENDIAYVTTDCQYQGECTGTCPKCEAEVRYLEQELAKRQKAGKAIAVAGIAATIMVSNAACSPSQTAGDPLPPSSQVLNNGQVTIPVTVGEVPETTLDIQGDIAYETEPPLMGEPVYTEPTTIPWPTMMGVPVYDDDYDETWTDDSVSP